MMPLRSLLFAPGDQPSKMRNALQVGADAVIFDLEDAVASSVKPQARGRIREILGTARACPVFVRINALDTAWALDDVEQIVPARPDGIIVPKIRGLSEMRIAEWLVGEIEHRSEQVRGSVDLVPIIETADGLANVRSIATGAERIRRLAFGAADFTQDMGIDWTPNEEECRPARAEIALASRLANLEPPIDSVWARLDDGDGLQASSTRARQMGFQGKMCIHPSQIETIHSAFAPDEAAVSKARRIVDAFAAAEASGAASILLDGQFIDYPIAERARQLVARADASGSDERGH